MKKILLLSDTHCYLDDAILKHVAQADEVWHAGDIGTIETADQIAAMKPLRAVYGNIDDAKVRQVYPLHNRFVCEGLNVWITHIGGYPGRYNPAIKTDIQLNPPQLFISGHSHILRVMRDVKQAILHMNPGAAGVHGFHKMRTMLRFEINDGMIRKVEVIELGLRGSLPKAVG